MNRGSRGVAGGYYRNIQHGNASNPGYGRDYGRQGQGQYSNSNNSSNFRSSRNRDQSYRETYPEETDRRHGNKRGTNEAYGQQKAQRYAGNGTLANQDLPEAPRRKPNAIKYCVNFAWNGTCHYGTKCRYPHAIECVAFEASAHESKGIRCCVIGGSDAQGNPEIFTGGKDHKLRRWNMCPAEKEKDSEAPSLRLECATNTDLGADICTIVFVSGALFAGLYNGTVRVFLTNGHVQDLQAHTSSVHTLAVVEGVLISGDWSGVLAFWKYETETSSFVLSHKMNIEGSINCIVAIDIPSDFASNITPGQTNPTPTQPPTKVLWIGGTSLCILDLASLQVRRTIDIADAQTNTTPLVVSMVKFDTFILTGFANGLIRAYTAAGEVMYSYQFDYLSTMTGLDSPQGPVLICGGRRSTATVLKLPQFEELGSLPITDSGDIRVIHPLGPLHFITCGEDSSLIVWKWTDNNSKPTQEKP